MSSHRKKVQLSREDWGSGGGYRAGEGQETWGIDRGRDQGGNDGGRSQDGDPQRSQMMAHGGVEGGRRHGGDLADETWRTTNRDLADGGGDPDGAATTSVQGGAGCQRTEAG